MAAVAMSLSTMLNPNAPIYVPAAFRQVEDFSPEWWELVKTSAWFREYWLSEHGEESFAADDDDDELLPECFDLGFDEELADLNVQFKELPESESREKKYRNGVGNNGKEAISVLLKNQSMGNPKAKGGWENQRSPKSRLGGGRRSYFDKAAKKKVNLSLRRIQQPR